MQLSTAENTIMSMVSQMFPSVELHISCGWRYTIPVLLDQGIRVIAPDLIGYGQTDKPVLESSDNVVTYSLKSTGDDLAELLKQLDIPSIILIGHDWGNFTATSFTRFYPHLVSNIVGIAIPFTGPTKQYLPIEIFVHYAPKFALMAEYADDSKFADRLTTLYGGALDAEKIKALVLLGALAGRPRSGHVVSEDDLEYYVDQFTAGGFHGPSNWYKLRKQTYDDEKE
ncbi:Alpha/Beta hydrolase protein [Peziza echinospora]|nr:Alpha/Beta hydrolase protein [Peziza echinospora]